jgi:hypothetical protein
LPHCLPASFLYRRTGRYKRNPAHADAGFRHPWKGEPNL